MVTYKCPRCGYSTDQKSHFKNHLSRKNVCEAVLSDVSIDTILAETFIERPKKMYCCEYCIKGFNSPQLKYQHKQRCPHMKAKQRQCAESEMLTRIEELERKLVECQKQTVITNQTNTQNNNFNILINVRDFAINENKDYLKPELLLECFRDMDLINVLEEIHFNPDHPENHNVRIKNVKQGLMEYVDNGKWVTNKKDEVLNHLIMNGYRVLHTYFKDNKDEIEDELADEEIDDSLGWLKKIYNEDKQLTKELRNDAFLLIMNNKALLLGKV